MASKQPQQSSHTTDYNDELIYLMSSLRNSTLLCLFLLRMLVVFWLILLRFINDEIFIFLVSVYLLLIDCMVWLEHDIVYRFREKIKMLLIHILKDYQRRTAVGNFPKALDNYQRICCWKIFQRLISLGKKISVG